VVLWSKKRKKTKKNIKKRAGPVWVRRVKKRMGGEEQGDGEDYASVAGRKSSS